MAELAPMQQRFVEEYVIDLNASAAALRAGYSKRTAGSQGGRLLKNVEISAEIERLLYERRRRTEITADTVLFELLRLARVDVGQAFDENGCLKALHAIPEDVRRAIAGIEVDELFDGRGDQRERIGYTRKVKFWDKNRALELLGKHLKLFTEKVEHSADETLEALIRASFTDAPKGRAA